LLVIFEIDRGGELAIDHRDIRILRSHPDDSGLTRLYEKVDAATDENAHWVIKGSLATNALKINQVNSL